MSVNLPTHYVQQFANNVVLLLQQRGSKLRGLVENAFYVGKQGSPVDQLGAVEMSVVTGRFQPIGRTDAPTDRRWVFPTDFDLNQLIDHFDKLKMLTDPESKYVLNGAYAAGRQIDDIIIDAFFDDAKTGETGTVTTIFPASNQVAVDFGASGNVGMTVAKLKRARRLLKANEVDFEIDRLGCALPAIQEEDLLGEAQIISTDFNSKPVLVDGNIDKYLGIFFKHSERINTDTNSFRRVPVWAMSGMHVGLWNDMVTDISHRKDLRGLPWQAYIILSAGATRLEEKKTMEIKCAES